VFRKILRIDVEKHALSSVRERRVSHVDAGIRAASAAVSYLSSAAAVCLKISGLVSRPAIDTR
jgi:hypothetical protein